MGPFKQPKPQTPVTPISTKAGRKQQRKDAKTKHGGVGVYPPAGGRGHPPHSTPA